jgi:replicative DNA helicase
MRLVDDVVREESVLDLCDRQIGEWGEAVRKRLAGEQPMPGLPLPWEGLTEFWGSLTPGLHVLAARPSAGKTTLEGQIATHLAMNGIPVGRATLDMGAQQLAGRMLAEQGEVSAAKLNFGFGGQADLQRVRDARDLMGANGLPMWINAQERDVSGICAWARSMALRRGMKLLTVDYCELVGASALGRMESDDVKRVTYVSHAFKRLAYELGIPVLLLSQLDRAVEKEDRAPRLSDLRWSGAVEQDADYVLFLWIDTKKRKQMEDPSKGGKFGATKHKRPVWIFKAKDKGGATDKMPLWMYPPYFRFVEAELGEDGTAFGDDELPGAGSSEC